MFFSSFIERLLSDLYTPNFMDGFSYQASKSEEHERVRKHAIPFLKKISCGNTFRRD